MRIKIRFPKLPFSSSHSQFARRIKKPAQLPHNSKTHGHDKIVQRYYSGSLLRLVAGATGGMLAFGYQAATGKIQEKTEEAWQELQPPAVPGNVEMVTLDTKDCLPIPSLIYKTLNQGFLSSHRKSNALVISGEGGCGKFDLARQIAFLLREKSSKPCNTIVEINGHTKASMEQGIIDVAKKLGFSDDKIQLDDAKSFLRTELFKKRTTVIIVRCLRMEAINDNLFPLQNIVNGFLGGWVRPNAYVIYTTGQPEVVAKSKEFAFYQVSLSQSYRVEDFQAYVNALTDNSPLKIKVANAGSALMPLFINKILENNPARARMAIRYLENTSTPLMQYIKMLEAQQKDLLLSSSLHAIDDAYCDLLLKKIAVLPQKKHAIDAVVESMHSSNVENKWTTYQNVSLALQKLDKFGLVRIDPQHNCVYPLLLVRQTNDFLQSKPTQALGFWDRRTNSETELATNEMTRIYRKG